VRVLASLPVEVIFVAVESEHLLRPRPVLELGESECFFGRPDARFRGEGKVPTELVEA
jgi:hypothetical protein